MLLYKKNLTCKRILQQVFTVYLSEAPSPQRFLFGWCSNFVGSESGQKQSVKLMQNMVSNRTQHPLPAKAVNREDKRSRRHRDRDFPKFERSRRYRDR
jgi:hypothetical protein